ncbi:hypothetical protein GGI04_001771 [Coemansia thaxteri]|uniref:MIR domain-containing protein n=1 Tax=Coemansia thaxteri TaxID=2663907 RepID=A0A9W8EJL1_9FUNG|nr:hypothetical protein H4R26_003012 [Coemansia thaxteri]KAJ2006741.1 hypothetical protein GGI04_001771 [Coemansia thaxteri]KAJ2469317.1 hypothetical protein GGI02_003431 [Coemansia sp. RSA 2322]KAJ2484104.1 hypothetical protein EV174_002700 [Coemansia sp. RSA 2320]
MSYNSNNNNYDDERRNEDGEGERGIGRFFGRGDNNSPQPGHNNQQRPMAGAGPSQYSQGSQGHGNMPQGQQQGYGNMPQGQQQHHGGGNMPGDDYSQDDVERNERNARYKDWGTKAGIAALGAAAIGAAAYGIHEYRENKEEEEEEEKRKQAEEQRRREDEERRRREEEDRRRRQDEDNKHNQGGWTQQPHPSTDSAYGGGGYNNQSEGGFRPPAPFGRPPYSFRQDDVRSADPSRSSDNSPTPHEYPKLRGASDSVIKIGSVIALKHNMTGRFLHTDRSHSTQTGSNQQLVFGYRWNTDENDWWQVLPANRDVPVPGSVVAYGTQIRLRHIETGRHLHSHYNYHEARSGQNEITAYGDSMHSDENDHWVIERWGNGAYGQTWNASDVVVLRHYVSGMALHSHDIQISEDVQSVTCFGPGAEENDKWRVQLE